MCVYGLFVEVKQNPRYNWPLPSLNPLFGYPAFDLAKMNPRRVGNEAAMHIERTGSQFCITA